MAGKTPPVGRSRQDTKAITARSPGSKTQTHGLQSGRLRTRPASAREPLDGGHAKPLLRRRPYMIRDLGSVIV
jgi:hypothetical protein